MEVRTMREHKLLPARKVQERFDVVDRTLDRWVSDPRLQFPRPVVINRRRYFVEAEIEAFEQRRRAEATAA